MKKKATINPGHRQLIRRYLLWAYKTTKEEFERIERKTTQLAVDKYILDHITANEFTTPPQELDAFKDYIAGKRKDELKLKYAANRKDKLHPRYVYLRNRLEAIEAAVQHFLGSKEFKRVSKLYEEEFTRRILEAREHG